MPLIRLNNFGFSPLTSDIDANSLAPEMFSSAFNFRAVDDKLVSYNGMVEMYAAPSDFNAAYIAKIKTPVTTFYVMLGLTDCMAFDGSSWASIKPAAGFTLPTGGEMFWSHTMLGAIPIFNNSQLAPTYWSPQSLSQKLQYLPFDFPVGVVGGRSWAYYNYKAKVFRAHRNFLFALNLTEGSDEFPYSYRWSHPADINGLPPSWDETDQAYIASKEQLSGNIGAIVDGSSLRDAFCIYSESGITLLDYVGGEFIWQARQLSSAYGLAAQNALVEFNDLNALLVDSDIVVNNGNDIESVLTRKLRRRLSSNISNDNYKNCFAVHVANMSEVWFFIVESGHTYPNIAYIYNYSTNVVSLREVNVIHAAYSQLVEASDSFDGGSVGTIDSDGIIFNTPTTSPFSSVVLGIGTEHSIIYNLDETETSYNTYFERTNFTPNGLDEATTIVAIYPKIEGTGQVKIEIGSQQHYDGPVAWKQEILFEPATQRRVALRTTGKFHCWKISSIGTSKFKISGMDIEYVNSGSR